MWRVFVCVVCVVVLVLGRENIFCDFCVFWCPDWYYFPLFCCLEEKEIVGPWVGRKVGRNREHSVRRESIQKKIWVFKRNPSARQRTLQEELLTGLGDDKGLLHSTGYCSSPWVSIINTWKALLLKILPTLTPTHREVNPNQYGNIFPLSDFQRARNCFC